MWPAKYAGAEVIAAALAPLVRPGGRIVSIATPVEPPAGSGITAMHMVARNAWPNCRRSWRSSTRAR